MERAVRVVIWPRVAATFGCEKPMTARYRKKTTHGREVWFGTDPDLEQEEGQKEQKRQRSPLEWIWLKKLLSWLFKISLWHEECIPLLFVAFPSFFRQMASRLCLFVSGGKKFPGG